MTTEEQNVQIAKAGYAAFGRGDIGAILALLDEDIVWKTPGSGVSHLTGVHNGHRGVAEFFSRVAEIWEYEAFEPREYIAGGNHVAVVGYYRVRSRKTGRTAESDWTMVWKFRNGKTVHFQEFNDSAVLEAALTEASAATH
jgi:ketosteroid isomerase-like protein